MKKAWNAHESKAFYVGLSQRLELSRAKVKLRNMLPLNQIWAP
jgi:hypothetical protein